MVHGKSISATALIAFFLLAGPAIAQQSEGTTTGPATGSDVEPTTAIQKDYEGRSAAPQEQQEQPGMAPPAASGMPGAEGQPGTQSGPAAR
jgi:hypothetical protein